MPLELIPHLHKATHQVGLFVGRQKRKVSQAEAHILAHLATVTECTIAELHASFGHKRSTLTSILNRLEDRGLVRRKINPADKRSFIIELTRRGRPLADKVYESLRALERVALARLKKSQLQGFVAVMHALSKAADER